MLQSNMEKRNLKGAILTELFNLAENMKNSSMGEVFYSFLRPIHLNGKTLSEATDTEIYQSLERAIEVEDVEEPCTEAELKNWADGK